MNEYEVEIDGNKIADLAEDMLGSIAHEQVSMAEMMSTLALIISTLGHEYDSDSTLLIHNIESIVNVFESME